MCKVIVYIVYGCVLRVCESGPGNDKQEPLSLSLWVEEGTQQESHAMVPVGS